MQGMGCFTSCLGVYTEYFSITKGIQFSIFLVFTNDGVVVGVVVGVVIKSAERYDLLEIKPIESEAEH